MLKDTPRFRRDMEACQASIATADGPELEELLIVLTEILINEYFSPSAPTLIKLSIYFLTNNERITDNMLIGLDDGSSKVGLTTTFVENYYQVCDDDLSNFQLNECAEGKFEERSTLGGDYESAPGYQRLCAERQVFTSEDTAAAYDETWLQLWTMLKSVLCSHSEITPDIDLARRRSEEELSTATKLTLCGSNSRHQALNLIGSGSTDTTELTLLPSTLRGEWVSSVNMILMPWDTSV